MERRMFHREALSVNGELKWYTKSRLGRKESHRSFIQTINLSLDGAKIELDGIYQFEVKSRARLQLGIAFTDVTVLEVGQENGFTTLRLVFMAPNTDFIAFLEENLPTITQDRQFYEGKWT